MMVIKNMIIAKFQIISELTVFSMCDIILLHNITSLIICYRVSLQSHSSGSLDSMLNVSNDEERSAHEANNHDNVFITQPNDIIGKLNIWENFVLELVNIIINLVPNIFGHRYPLFRSRNMLNWYNEWTC